MPPSRVLPFFPTEAKSILKWVPILEELNDYGLNVTGLKAGQYDILVDGKKVARHSNVDLVAGLNLAATVLDARETRFGVPDVRWMYTEGAPPISSAATS